jgi:hypothetical protein
MALYPAAISLQTYVLSLTACAAKTGNESNEMGGLQTEPFIILFKYIIGNAPQNSCFAVRFRLFSVAGFSEERD